MKLWKKKLTPQQVRKMFVDLNVELSDSTAYRHSKKFVWELTNDQSYDDWGDDYFTIKVLRDNQFFEAITPRYARKLLNYETSNNRR